MYSFRVAKHLYFSEGAKISWKEGEREWASLFSNAIWDINFFGPFSNLICINLFVNPKKSNPRQSLFGPFWDTSKEGAKWRFKKGQKEVITTIFNNASPLFLVYVKLWLATDPLGCGVLSIAHYNTFKCYT